MKRSDFKATESKGLLKSRVTQKQVDEFTAKKVAVVKKSAAPKKK